MSFNVSGRCWFRPLQIIVLVALSFACVKATRDAEESRAHLPSASEGDAPFVRVEPPAGIFQFSDLQTIVSASSSVEDILGKLPARYRRWWTLVHTSKSLQKTGERNLEKPRAILFGEDAKVIMSFQADSSMSRGDQLEVIQWDELSKSFIFHTIAKQDGHMKLVSSPRNSDGSGLCSSCHAAGGKVSPELSLRPIFENYPDWPGFYGEDNDDLKNDERQGLIKFKAQMKQHPRYRYLVSEAGADPLSPPLPGPFAPFRDSKFVSKVSVTQRPGFAFGLLVNLLNAQKTAARILQSPLYPPVKHNLLFRILCVEDRLDGSNPLKERFVTTAEQIEEKLGKSLALFYPLPLRHPLRKFQENLVESNNEIPLYSWNLDSKRSLKSYNAGTLGGEEYDFVSTILFKHYLENEGDLEPKIDKAAFQEIRWMPARYTEGASVFEAIINNLGQRYSTKPFSQYHVCASLETRAKNEMTNLLANPAQIPHVRLGLNGQ